MIPDIDKQMFTCIKCRGEFSEAQGTWLPIGSGSDGFMEKLNDSPAVFNFNMKQPEATTSTDFTCYNCLDLVKCPDCTTDIDGSYFNCNSCDNTGFVTPKRREEIIGNKNFWNRILKQQQ